MDQFKTQTSSKVSGSYIGDLVRDFPRQVPGFSLLEVLGSWHSTCGPGLSPYGTLRLDLDARFQGLQ